MLRTLAFAGVAAVAYNQLRKNGSIDRFKADLKKRTDALRAHIDEKRAGYKSESGGSDAATQPPAAPAGAI